MPLTATIEPISTPLSSQIREVLQQAAEIVATTLNQFMVQASLEKAQAIIDQEKIIRLSQEDAKVFFNALDNPPPPNDNLLKAVAAYKDSSLYVQNRNPLAKHIIASNSIAETNRSTDTCGKRHANIRTKV